MDEILYYINQDIDSVKNNIVQMTSGIPIEITFKGYGAEQIGLNNRNQILSAMTVYGFLNYHNGEPPIPNKELLMKFEDELEDNSMDEISKLVLQPSEMLNKICRYVFNYINNKIIYNK